MALRQLVIERPVQKGKPPLRPLVVTVSDEAGIGPWMTMLIAQCGYPAYDSFGTPISYRLRSVPEGTLFPPSGRFAEVPFRSGTRVVLEAEATKYETMPLARKTPLSKREKKASYRLSRRSLLVATPLTLMSLLGLGSGMVTARWVQVPSRVPTQQAAVTMHREAITLGHQQTIRTLSWSPDGKLLATGGDDATVLLWAADGRLLHTLPFDAGVRCLAWSPSGTQLMVGAGNAVSFFDGQSATLLLEDAREHGGFVTGVAWTQTTPTFAISVSTDRRAIVWNGETHQREEVFSLHTAAIEAVSTSGPIVATASQGGVIRVWDARSGHEQHGYFSETTQVQRTLAFSAQGLLAAGGDDGQVRLWHGRVCQQQMPAAFGLQCVDQALLLTGHTKSVRAVAFSADGAFLATGGDDGMLQVWSTQTMLLVTRQRLNEPITALAWWQNRLAVASGSQVVFWQVTR